MLEFCFVWLVYLYHWRRCLWKVAFQEESSYTPRIYKNIFQIFHKVNLVLKWESNFKKQIHTLSLYVFQGTFYPNSWKSVSSYLLQDCLGICSFFSSPLVFLLFDRNFILYHVVRLRKQKGTVKFISIYSKLKYPSSMFWNKMWYVESTKLEIGFVSP